MDGHAITVILTEVEATLPAIGTGLAIIIASWIIAELARRGVARLGRRSATAYADVVSLGAAIAFWSAITFGIVMGLGTMGIHVEPLVASLGLTGFAVGFALRDAISNLLAGVLILTYRPFRSGDRIAVAGFEGVVVKSICATRPSRTATTSI
jgi:small conductance mechanosensitive channel